MKLLAALPLTTWTLLEDLPNGTTQSARVRVRCDCGREGLSRVGDIIAGGSRTCYACACRIKSENSVRSRREAGVFYDEAELNLASRGRSARQRCENPKVPCYANYGGRGIRFRFPTIRAYVDYVSQELGPPPFEKATIDRIDNDGDYAPGNLRWASRAAQGENRRPSSWLAHGGRIAHLQQLRPDYSYESLRGFVLQGISDDEILAREKSTSGRPTTARTFKTRKPL